MKEDRKYSSSGREPALQGEALSSKPIYCENKFHFVRLWSLTPAILATQEAEIKRTVV
jgi:hypothetical protein